MKFHFISFVAFFPSCSNLFHLFLSPSYTDWFSSTFSFDKKRWNPVSLFSVFTVFFPSVRLQNIAKQSTTRGHNLKTCNNLFCLDFLLFLVVFSFDFHATIGCTTMFVRFFGLSFVWKLQTNSADGTVFGFFWTLHSFPDFLCAYICERYVCVVFPLALVWFPLWNAGWTSVEVWFWVCEDRKRTSVFGCDSLQPPPTSKRTDRIRFWVFRLSVNTERLGRASCLCSCLDNPTQNRYLNLHFVMSQHFIYANAYLYSRVIL